MRTEVVVSGTKSTGLELHLHDMVIVLELNILSNAVKNKRGEILTVLQRRS